MKLSERTEWLNVDAAKPLEVAIVVPALRRALVDLVKLTPPETRWVLGGALALGLYGKSRTTLDIDILLVTDRDADDVARASRKKFGPPEINNMKHLATGVKVDFVTPTTVAVPRQYFEMAFEQSVSHTLSGAAVSVLSAKWLVAFKLARFSRQDQADIETILRNCGPIDLIDADLPPEWLQRFEILVADINRQ